ncbi:36181_t:CDS:2 [Gigaspora margarita]|uniref:36181_t:CDS:1 n=1 Tax=Gigaspora margarita TaxID=4874 RepID=A0ABN7W397_GIGMA|nr:36181_t:CDS:2 [Gigaspora margarita]
MFETKNYPKSSIIEAKTSCNKFKYHIIQEGIYPSKNILAYTLKPNQYRIPHNYVVETTYGRGKSQKTILCSINYQNNIPEFKIEFTYNNNNEVIISRSNNVTFEGLTFTVDSQKFRITYKEINTESINLQIQAIIRAMDSEKISGQAYRLISAIGHDLPREWAVSNMRQQINQQMKELIPIHLIDLNLSQEVYGRNVGHKVKHVMVTFVLLNDYMDHHYTLMLYPGIETYTNLKIALTPLIEDLNEIVNGYWDKQAEIQINTNMNARLKISQEMKRIKVNFHWWEDPESKTWKSNSLNGEDKLKVLKNFNLNILFKNLNMPYKYINYGMDLRIIPRYSSVSIIWT